MPPPPGVTFTPFPKPPRAGGRVGASASGGWTPPPTRRELPCVHEGPVVTSCPFGNEALHVRHCMHPKADWDTCSRGHAADANRSCLDCPAGFYTAPRPPVIAESPQPAGWPVRFDERNCWPGAPGLRFNSSILPHDSGYLFAYRNGWRGSEIFVGRLDGGFRPVGSPVRLALYHPDANYGREDVRLFIHGGRPHVSYIGVVGGRRIRHTNQLFARLTADGMSVEDVFSPVDYPQGRAKQEPRPWEKNWGFFDHDGDLYAVYTIAPHRVLRVRSNEAELAYSTPTPFTWHGGELRGGAAPVRVEGEYWSFFHDRVTGVDGKLQYRTGLYTFDARPPFRPLRYILEPILVADPATRPSDQYASVVFAGGAVRVGDDWIVAHGVHDRWSELHRFAHADLESRLIRVAPPPWWSMRDHWADPGIFAAVVGHNEYQLPEQLPPGSVVLDIGAHVGSFAYAAHCRGAETIHCYEPWGESLTLLRANASRMPGVVVHADAVGAAFGRGRFSGLSHADNTGSGNVALDESGDVLIVPLDECIRRAGCDVALLKIDAEGAEGPALENATLLHCVRRVVGEWHPPLNAEWVKGVLKDFDVDTVPGEDGRGLFFARGREA
jgi:FkbM family methyltransferase